MTEDEMLDGITDSMGMSLSKLLEKTGVLQSKGSQRVGCDVLLTEQQPQEERDFGGWSLGFSPCSTADWLLTWGATPLFAASSYRERTA